MATTDTTLRETIQELIVLISEFPYKGYTSTPAVNKQINEEKWSWSKTNAMIILLTNLLQTISSILSYDRLYLAA